jgi:acetyl-CoA C-acetyltransferase
MVASPYTKLCCSNLRVNQTAALLVTTVGTARALGIPTDRWVFPHGAAVCNHAVPVVQRPDLARSPVAASATATALSIAGVGVYDLGPVDLYSCFPVAVQVAAAQLGLSTDRPLTLTGGMTFAGGPLNSYVLHSTAAMADALRAAPGETGLVTAVSGFLTKYGAAVWSAEPPTSPWRSEDTTDEVAREAGAPRAERAAVPGEDVTVAGATVEHRRDGSRELVAVGDLADGRRTIVRTTDAPAIEEGLAETLVGGTVRAA